MHGTTMWMVFLSATLMVLMLAIAIYTDIRTGKIHNALTVPCATLGLGLNFVASGWEGALQSLEGLAVGFGVFLVSSLFGRILGGGDVKLLMAIGAIHGPTFLLWTIVYMAIIGAVLAIVIALWRGDVLASLRRLGGGLLMRLLAKAPMDITDAKAAARLPYAIPIALGSLVTLYLLKLR